MFTKQFGMAFAAIAVCVIVLGQPVEGFGQPRINAQSRAAINHPVPRYGRGVARLPARHQTVIVGKSHYFFHNRGFYRNRPPGYVVGKAPIGAFVSSIPVGHISLFIGSMPYFYYGGVYYRRIPSGYVVVEAPPKTVIVEETTAVCEDLPAVGERVTVTGQLLNVRSGPGENHSVIGQIRQGTVVVVRGHAPGWFYVELPNGKFGWIMLEFTS